MSFFLTSPNAIDLGVNIDHVATLRNARGTSYPDPCARGAGRRRSRGRRHHAASARRPQTYRRCRCADAASAAENADEPGVRGHPGDARYRLRTCVRTMSASSRKAPGAHHRRRPRCCRSLRSGARRVPSNWPGWARGSRCSSMRTKPRFARRTKPAHRSSSCHTGGYAEAHDPAAHAARIRARRARCRTGRFAGASRSTQVTGCITRTSSRSRPSRASSS